MSRPSLFLARMAANVSDDNLWAYQVPESLEGYIVRSIIVEATTDATVANRQYAVSIENKNQDLKTTAAESTFQTASEVNLHTFGGTGSPYESAGGVSTQGGGAANFAVHTPMQATIIEGGDIIRFEAAGAAAGDTYTPPLVWFEAISL